MESELIKIKCPNCGAILTIKNMPGLESKTIPCPVCKKASPYTEYKSPVQKQHFTPEEDETNPGDVTQLKGGKQKQGTIGKLQSIKSGKIYPLGEGKNTIGRKANTSNANIQIETDDKTMSRQHAVIEVRKTNTECIHCFYNDQNKNETFINSQLVEKGDRIILKGGEILKMANTVLKFINEAKDDTEYRH